MEQDRRSKFVDIIKANTNLTRLIKALGEQLEMLIKTGKTNVNGLLLVIFKENVLTEEEYGEIIAGLAEVSRLHTLQYISRLHK
jgi:hypothetical protein